jgi:endonuclease III
MSVRFMGYHVVSVVQQKYDKLIDAMPVHVKVARAAQMFQWSRDWAMRQVLAEKGPMTERRLRLELALRMYGHEEPMRLLIRKALSHVPD